MSADDLNAEDEMPSSCNFLKNPLSISDLIDSGSKFEINTNFDEGFTNDIFDELNVGSDDDEDTEADRSALVSPWTKSFEELKQQMVQVNEHLHKKVIKEGNLELGPVPNNARVCIRYNAYWECEGAPFDSSFLRGSTHSFYTGRNEVIEGLEVAVRTMHKGEQAQFVISYYLLFREMGCPPRVKPRADGLFIIELVSFNEVGSVDADQDVPEQDRNKFAVVLDKVKEIHLKGLDFFGQGLHRNACRAFEKAVDMLCYCRLSDEKEEREQRAFLLKLYTNLAVCYIKINAPAKTCIMVKEIRQLTDNQPSCKALFQEGRALLMLADYDRSRQVLTRAQRMEPQNEDISKELKVLEDRYTRYKANEKSIWTKAMGVMQESDTKALPSESTDTVFETEMLKLMESLKNNVNMEKLKLPPGLTKTEIETVDELAKRLELKLTLSPLDNNSYTLSKK